MSDDFVSLQEKYGDSSKIPDLDLYKYITRKDVFENVKNYLDVGLEQLKNVPLVQEVRKRCEQDLWWLGKYFLVDTDVAGSARSIEESFFVDHVHKRIADLFVKKDKTKSIGEQDWRKDREILYPRGVGKSAWDRYDTVQWVLNFPDIRILYLTSVDDLAEGFVQETKNHFLIREDNPSLMNVYFPEYCFLEKDQGAADRLTCPIWADKKIDRKEPTVWAAGIGKSFSGNHFEVLKADDTVSDANSGNDKRCRDIAEDVDLKRKMLVPYGYTDKIGTRYADEDMYGEDLRKNIGKLNKESGPNWEIIDNLDTGLRILIGRSIVIKPEIREKLERENRPVTYKEAGEDGCTLLFPEYHSYKWCLYEYNKNEKIFEGQQNQNPRSLSYVVFDRSLLVKHTISFDNPLVPSSGPMSQFWDFSYSTEKGRDYSTGSCIVWNPQNKAIVLDIVRGRFKPSSLAKAVVDMAVKYQPFIIGIEKSAGAEFLHSAIMQEAYKTKIPQVIDVCSRIDWVKPDQGKDAKQTRIKALHPWLTNDMLYFVSHILDGNIEILYDEFERCTSAHHHEDIPDVISYNVRYARTASPIVQQQQLEHYSRTDGNWHNVFDSSGELYGQGMYSPICSPFKGYVLIHNPDTYQIELISEQIENPIVQVFTETDTPKNYNIHGLDPILGGL